MLPSCEQRAAALFMGVALTMCVGLGSAKAAEPAELEPQPRAPRARAAAPVSRVALADQARNLTTRPALNPIDVALILPRLALTFPRYAVKLLFYPVEKTIELADRHAAVARAVGAIGDALPVRRESDPLATGEEDSPAGVSPQVELDSFSGLSVGLKAFDEDLAGHDEYGSAEARIGGPYHVAAQLAFRASRFGGSRLWLESLARYESEPALLFQGIGRAGSPTSGVGLAPRGGSVATRYAQERSLNVLRAGYTSGERGRLLQVGATALYSIRSVRPSEHPQSIETVYDTRELPGFGARVGTWETDLNLIFNTLEPPLLASSGVYIDAFMGRVPELTGFGYWHEGVDATLYVNLYRGDRVLVLRALVEGVEGGADEIPFADLPSIGGPHRLRGYARDRFRDTKAALGSVDYHYPIHQYVAGALFFEVGRVERELADFFDRHWSSSFGAGFFIRSREKQLFSFHVAYGDNLQFYLTTDPWRVFSKQDSEL
jgi:hypothetical protein